MFSKNKKIKVFYSVHNAKTSSKEIPNNTEENKEQTKSDFETSKSHEEFYTILDKTIQNFSKEKKEKIREQIDTNFQTVMNKLENTFSNSQFWSDLTQSNQFLYIKKYIYINTIKQYDFNMDKNSTQSPWWLNTKDSFKLKEQFIQNIINIFAINKQYYDQNKKRENNNISKELETKVFWENEKIRKILQYFKFSWISNLLDNQEKISKQDIKKINEFNWKDKWNFFKNLYKYCETRNVINDDIKIDYSEPLKSYYHNYPLDEANLPQYLKKIKKNLTLNDIYTINFICKNEEYNIIWAYKNKDKNTNNHKEHIEQLSKKLWIEQITNDPQEAMFEIKKFLYQNSSTMQTILDWKNSILWKLKNKDNKQLKVFFKYFTYADIENWEYQKKAKEKLYNVEQDDKEIIIETLNSINSNKSEKITEKTLEGYKTEKLKDLVMFIEWIKNPNEIKQTIIQKLENNQNLKEKIFDKNWKEPTLQDVLSEIFNKEWLKDITNKYKKKEHWKCYSFFHNYLYQKWLFDFIKEDNDQQKRKLTQNILSSISELWNTSNFEKIYNISSKNNKFNEFVDNFMVDMKKNNWEIKGKKWFKNEFEQQWILESFKYSLIKVFIKKWDGKHIDVDFLKKHKKNINDEIAKKINTLFPNAKDNENFQNKQEEIFQKFIASLPENWIEIQNVQSLREELKETNDILNEIQNYFDLWHIKYIEQHEQKDAEKEFLQKTWWVLQNEILIEESMLKNSKDNIKHNFEWWIHTFHMRLPDKKKVLEVKSLKCEQWNKELLKNYFNESFDFPLSIKWNTDLLNKLVSENTDLTKNWIKERDLDEIKWFIKYYIYENFFENAWKSEKTFMKENNLNIHNVYWDFNNFIKNFSNWVKKKSKIWWFEWIFGNFSIDLEKLDNNFFYKKNRENKEKTTIKNWEEYYTKKQHWWNKFIKS